MSFPTDSIEELVICISVVFIFWLIVGLLGDLILKIIGALI